MERTPVYLLATAGMRLLPDEQRDAVLEKTCTFIRDKTPFHAGKTIQSCLSDHVQVISGEQEGLLGWIAINYLMDGFHFQSLDAATTLTSGDAKGKEVTAATQKSTYGFLDMGGASTQIAFEPSLAALSSSKGQAAEDDLKTVHLRMLDGQDVSNEVFVTTWLGFGTNQARSRFVDQLYLNATHKATSQDLQAALADPCLPTGLVLPSSPSKTVAAEVGGTISTNSVVGTGSFQTCLTAMKPLLEKDATCAHPPCLFYGVHVPPIDFSVNHFIGVSEYWYSSHDIFGLGGVYDYVEFQEAAVKYCSRNWTDLEAEFKAGKYGANVDEGRLRMQCFKAAWMATVLHEGIGIPRIIDSKGTGDGKDHADQAQDKADDKNLFQSVNDVRGLAVSWTLGKAVLEASGSVRSIHGELAGDVAGQVDGTSPGPGNWKHEWPWSRPSAALRPEGYSVLFVFGLALLALSALACWLINRSRSSRAPRGFAAWLPPPLGSCGGLCGRRRPKEARYVPAASHEPGSSHLEMTEAGFLGTPSELSSSEEDVDAKLLRSSRRRGRAGAGSTVLQTLLPASWRRTIARTLVGEGELRKQRKNSSRGSRAGDTRFRQQEPGTSSHAAALRASRPASPAVSARPGIPSSITSRPPSRVASPFAGGTPASGTSSAMLSRTNSSANLHGYGYAGGVGSSSPLHPLTVATPGGTKRSSAVNPFDRLALDEQA